MRLFSQDKEQTILRLFSRGDRSAMDVLYAYAADRLYGVASRYIADEDDRKDVMQESLIKIYTRITDFEHRGKGSLMAWMVRITVNECIQRLRRDKAALTTTLDVDPPDETDDEALTVEGITADDVVEALRQLPEGYRTVFNLYVMEGMSHKEIARTLGIKADSSASQLSRAKTMLARILKAKNKQH